MLRTFDLLIGAGTPVSMKFAMAKMLGGGTPFPQPVPSMAKINFTPHSTDFLFKVELWHEALFAPAESLTTPKQAAATWSMRTPPKEASPWQRSSFKRRDAPSLATAPGSPTSGLQSPAAETGHSSMAAGRDGRPRRRRLFWPRKRKEYKPAKLFQPPPQIV